MEGKNMVKIARKDIEKYCFSILLKMSMYNTVILSGRGSNQNKQERLATLYKSIGLREICRETVEEEGLPTLKITLTKLKQDFD